MINYPERTVTDNTIQSSAMPTIQIQLDKSLAYRGNIKSTIYDVAHIDNYYFVETHEDMIHRLVWVQFEGYLPEIDADYDYSPLQDVQIAELPFKHDGHVGRSYNDTSNLDPKSDSAQTFAFLHGHSLRYPEERDYIMFRFVHLMGKPARDELLFIYIEILDDAPPEDLKEKGIESAQWEGFKKPYYERFMQHVRLSV